MRPDTASITIIEKGKQEMRKKSTGFDPKQKGNQPAPSKGAGIIKVTQGVAGLTAVIGGALLLSATAARPDVCIDDTAETGVPENSELCNLGALIDTGDSFARGVNGDGTVVVGLASVTSGMRAFRWDAETGMQDLRSLVENASSGATAVSKSGSVIVGASSSLEGERAFRWVEGDGMESLGVLAGGSQSSAYGVNADGTVIVGASESTDGIKAFRWQADTGMQSLGKLNAEDPTSFAYAVNDDGSVVVGSSGDWSDGFAFRWVEGDGMENLGTLDGGFYSEARGVNGDGTVVVGKSDAMFSERAFRWVEGVGMQDLGSLEEEGSSEAWAVNGDGTVVVGESSTSEGTRAFRWVEGSGMESLGTLEGGTFSIARAVNADGTVVVGESGALVVGDAGSVNRIRAFVWRTEMQDFSNLIGSVSLMAHDTDLVFAQQQDSVRQTMEHMPWVSAGQSVVRGGLYAARTGADTDDDIGQQTDGGGVFSYGYGASKAVTLGFTLGSGNSSLDNNGFDMSVSRAASLWGAYSEGGEDRTGLQAQIALGWGAADGDITRGRGLTDVMLSTGVAQLETRIARASIGYGMDHASGWILTPTLGVTRYTTTRDAYSESGGDFNASYDALTVERTSLTSSFSAETALNDRARLSLQVGVEQSLDDTAITLTGSSDIPGLVTFETDSLLERNRTRASIQTGYSYDLGNGATVSTTLGLAQPEFGTKIGGLIGVGYEMRF